MCLRGRSLRRCSRRPDSSSATAPSCSGLGSPARGLARAEAGGDLRKVRPWAYSPCSLAPWGEHLLRNGQLDLPFLAQVRAVLLSLGEGAVPARKTAAILWRLDMPHEPTLIDVYVPRGRTRVQLPGVRVWVRDVRHRGVLSLGDLDGMSSMSTVSTVVDCALQESLVDAVAIVDSALRLGKVTREELDQAAGARRGKPGAARLRQVLDLVASRLLLAPAPVGPGVRRTAVARP